MVASGIFITASNVAQGRVPPFFEPAYFLVMNPLHILTVAALVLAAIAMRRQTRWHRRLMFCSMALLIQLVAYSALGLAIYEGVTAGSAAAMPALEFPPVPGA